MKNFTGIFCAIRDGERGAHKVRAHFDREAAAVLSHPVDPMIPARVIGRVVTSQMVNSLRGVKLLLVHSIDETDQPAGPAFVACDAIGVNVGERVFLAQGREAAFPLPEPFNPADFTIVAIIDEIG